MSLLCNTLSRFVKCYYKGKVGVAQLCLTLCDSVTRACQTPLSVGFSSQEYWSGLPFPSPGDLLTQGSNPSLLPCGKILFHPSHQCCYTLF